MHESLGTEDSTETNFNKIETEWGKQVQRMRRNYKLNKPGFKDKSTELLYLLMEVNEKPIFGTVLRAYKIDLIWNIVISIIITMIDYSTTYIVYYCIGRLKHPDQYDDRT